MPNLDLESDNSIFQTICFELKSRQRKFEAWIWPFSISEARNSGSISSFTVKGLLKNEFKNFVKISVR